MTCKYSRLKTSYSSAHPHGTLLTNVIFLFAGNRVAADLPVLNSSQVPKETEHKKELIKQFIILVISGKAVNRVQQEHSGNNTLTLSRYNS